MTETPQPHGERPPAGVETVPPLPAEADLRRQNGDIDTQATTQDSTGRGGHDQGEGSGAA